MAGFNEPGLAAVQMFVDVVAAAFSRGGGMIEYGAGWHLIGMSRIGAAAYRLEFETAITLKGWDPAGQQHLEGPHKVLVTVEAAA